MAITLRLATRDDAPAIVAVVNAAYEVESHLFVGGRTSLEDVRGRIGAPDHAFLVVDDGGAIVGAVSVEWAPPRGYFGMLAVAPGAQGRGLGARLVRGAIARCAAAGCDVVEIDVAAQRAELPPFYARFGFVEFDRTPYGHPELTKVPVEMIRMRVAAR